ncbi:toll/interleukin-1 receptor domain-containing protein [Geodermatophilus sp. URMC 61]|uniref:toll/interleukin-1 receptor domain-containing protein n=1 Tax=Geodermatophilus sp. URMC 61 TaxID=3423411 RepID=UPI00406C2BE9
MSGRGTDFFISHAGRDTGWAEWLAWQLQQAGRSVELDVWDRPPIHRPPIGRTRGTPRPP